MILTDCTHLPFPSSLALLTSIDTLRYSCTRWPAVLISLSLVLVPRPPAPEGWDKDINLNINTSRTATISMINTTQYSNPFYFLSCVISLPDTVVSVSTFGLPCLCPSPSPPAPEGWDKDLNDTTQGCIT